MSGFLSVNPAQDRYVTVVGVSSAVSLVVVIGLSVVPMGGGVAGGVVLGIGFGEVFWEKAARSPAIHRRNSANAEETMNRIVQLRE